MCTWMLAEVPRRMPLPYPLMGPMRLLLVSPLVTATLPMWTEVQLAESVSGISVVAAH